MHLHAPSESKLIDVENVTFSYGKERILHDITLEVNRGDFLAFIGPNGGGKSTLMRLLLGLLAPSKGRITCNDKAIGYVPQNTDINTAFPITAIDVVLMGEERKLLGYSKTVRAKALDALKAVGLEAFAHHRIGDLSGGQRQRVMIARALQSDPHILMLDEPTSNIDPQGQHEIYELLRNLNERMTILVVSHDISVVVQYAKKVAYVNQTLTFHDISSMRTAFDHSEDSHFCEVELLKGMQNVCNHPDHHHGDHDHA